MLVSKLTLSNDLKHQRSTAATVLLWIQKHPKMSQQTTVNAIAGQVAILNPLVSVENAKEAINWMKKEGMLRWTSNGPRSTFKINYQHRLIPKEVLLAQPKMDIPVIQEDTTPQEIPVKVSEIPVKTEVPVSVNGASFTISLEIKVSVKVDENSNVKEISITKG